MSEEIKIAIVSHSQTFVFRDAASAIMTLDPNIEMLLIGDYNDLDA